MLWCLGTISGTTGEKRSILRTKKAPAKVEQRRLRGGRLLDANSEIFEKVHPGPSGVRIDLVIIVSVSDNG